MFCFLWARNPLHTFLPVCFSLVAASWQLMILDRENLLNALFQEIWQ
jgi:hypothetical protein